MLSLLLCCCGVVAEARSIICDTLQNTSSSFGAAAASTLYNIHAVMKLGWLSLAQFTDCVYAFCQLCVVSSYLTTVFCLPARNLRKSHKNWTLEHNNHVKLFVKAIGFFSE